MGMNLTARSRHTAWQQAYGGMSLAFNKLNYPPNSFEAAWGGNCVSNGQVGPSLHSLPFPSSIHTMPCTPNTLQTLHQP